MSGGYYEYAQYHINDIANYIEDYIYGHSLDEEDINDYIKSRWFEDKEKEYIRKNKHTKPNPFDYNKEKSGYLTVLFFLGSPRIFNPWGEEEVRLLSAKRVLRVVTSHFRRGHCLVRLL